MHVINRTGRQARKRNTKNAGTLCCNLFSIVSLKGEQKTNEPAQLQMDSISLSRRKEKGSIKFQKMSNTGPRKNQDKIYISVALFSNVGIKN